MKNIRFYLAFLLVLTSCQQTSTENSEKKTHPSHIYSWSSIERSELGYTELDYVPVYSDIYERDGTYRFMLATTISIRNNTIADSAYILHARYYDSYGSLLKDYIDSTILLKPLESIEFVVEQTENLGGAGANFIVEWGAKNYNDQVLIQAVMIGTFAGQGISFIADAKKISSVQR